MIVLKDGVTVVPKELNAIELLSIIRGTITDFIDAVCTVPVIVPLILVICTGNVASCKNSAAKGDISTFAIPSDPDLILPDVYILPFDLFCVMVAFIIEEVI